MDPLYNSIDSGSAADLQILDLSCSSLMMNSFDSESSITPSPFQRFRGTPLRSYSSKEEFQNSSVYAELESAVQASSKLVKKQDGTFDFDSEEGQKSVKKLFKILERVFIAFQINTDERLYRNEFTQAYRVLYKPGSLCFLTEIIDSAQEQIPYLWVNSEKYVFSNEVLEAGQNLFSTFQSLIEVLGSVLDGNLDDIISQAKTTLVAFDKAWAEYEHMYVLELMVIEADARRYIRKAISADREITERASQGLRGDDCRKCLVKLIGKINSVANIEGNGRDDLSADILDSAESLVDSENETIKKLSEAIILSYNNLRTLLKQYSLNIEEVDPQLKNNTELVKALEEFESSWGKGKSFLTNPCKREQLVLFSGHIQALAKRYQMLAEQVEFRDAELFMTVPALLIILKAKDSDKDLCRYFCPAIDQEGDRLHDMFEKLKELSRGCDWEYIEQAIIGLENRSDNHAEAIKIIKILGMELQRHKPNQWNEFFNIAMPN